MATTTKVNVSKFADKQVSRLPIEMKVAFYVWVNAVENNGIHLVRSTRGYRDEALQGKRKGQRSVRLNRAYRMIYEQFDDGKCHIIGVLEVNRHEY